MLIFNDLLDLFSGGSAQAGARRIAFDRTLNHGIFKTVPPKVLKRTQRWGKSVHLRGVAAAGNAVNRNVKRSNTHTGFLG